MQIAEMLFVGVQMHKLSDLPIDPIVLRLVQKKLADGITAALRDFIANDEPKQFKPYDGKP